MLSPEMQGKNSPLFHPSWKINAAHGLSRSGLFALCLLFLHPLVFNPGGSKGQEESISIE
jgi:hypothetical protein